MEIYFALPIKLMMLAMKVSNDLYHQYFELANKPKISTEMNKTKILKYKLGNDLKLNEILKS